MSEPTGCGVCGVFSRSVIDSAVSQAQRIRFPNLHGQHCIGACKDATCHRVFCRVPALGRQCFFTELGWKSCGDAATSSSEPSLSEAAPHPLAPAREACAPPLPPSSSARIRSCCASSGSLSPLSEAR